MLATSAGPPVGSMGVVALGELWVLDGDGLFLSGDSGGTWRQINAPSAGDPLADYMAIDFVDLQQGWVVASRENSIQVDWTVDGGATWTVAPLPMSLFPNGWGGADVHFINPMDGWISVRVADSGVSVVFDSIDGGATWTVMNDQAPVTSISFSTPTSGWGLSADGTSLYRTTDGGGSWAQVTLPEPSVAKTTNRGGWSTLTLPDFFGADGVLLAVPQTGNAITETTADGGETWKADVTPFTAEPAQVLHPGASPPCPKCVEPGDEPFAVLNAAQWRYWGGGRFYLTDDDGRAWSSLQPNVAFASLGTTLGRVGVDNEGHSDPLQFTSPEDGWALVSTNSTPSPQSVLLRIENGGRDFTAVPPPSGPQSPQGSSG
ncbi:MAG: WD40/YVTN/BNR-like repeat-containing protein [Acidimicrobiales bacterium]